MAVVNGGINETGKVRRVNWWLNEWMKLRGSQINRRKQDTLTQGLWSTQLYTSSLQRPELLLKYLLQFVVQAFPADWRLWKQSLLFIHLRGPQETEGHGWWRRAWTSQPLFHFLLPSTQIVQTLLINDINCPAESGPDLTIVFNTRVHTWNEISLSSLILKLHQEKNNTFFHFCLKVLLNI